MAYIDTSNMPLHMPVPGTREPAQIALLNENCIVLDGHDHGTGKGLAIGRLRSGLDANRPAAGTAGNVYFSTDTGRFYVDTGTAWVQFLTEGGQGTVTGWTLIDPVVRDTIQFGPEGSGTIDATLTRPAALALQTDSKFGVGVTPDPQWGPNLRIVQFGSAGALVGYTGTDAEEVQLTGNTVGRADSKQYAMITNSPANRLRLSQGALIFESAPSAAAGAEQTFTTRLTAGITGTLTLASALGAQALDIQQQSTDINGVPSVMIRRGAPASQHQTIRFQNGASLGDFDIGRRAGSDDLRFMFWNGSTLTDRFALDPNGLATFTGNGANAMVGIRSSQDDNNAYQQLIFGRGVGSNANMWRIGQNIGGGNINLFDIYDDAQAKAVVRIARGTGTVNLYPASGQVAIAVSNPTFLMTSTGSIVMRAANGNMHVNPQGTIFGPEADGVTNLGYSSVRWAQIWSTIPSISTSHVSTKRDFAPLDPTACADAVLETDWLEYDYVAPAGESEALRSESEVARHQRGYVLGSPDHKVSDLFGLADRHSASLGADLAVVACALQDALRRLAALEGKDGSAAAA